MLFLPVALGHKPLKYQNKQDNNKKKQGKKHTTGQPQTQHPT
jgi:hypothetical protein